MKKSYWLKEFFTPHEAHSHEIKRFLVSKKTKFQKAVLADTYSFGRCLILDGEMQSAELDEFIYHEALVHPGMMMHRKPQDILILGGGEGATARELLRYPSVRRVVMVDIDGEVVEFCKKYLTKWHQGAFKSEKLELVIGDGRKYVLETKDRFDLVISDLPTPIEAGPAYMLYTIEFYRKLRKILKPGGIFTIQSGSGSLLQIKFNTMLYTTLKKVFKNVSPYYTYVPSFDVPWSFMICGDAVNPQKLTPARLNQLIRRRVGDTLRFYDGETHLGMFCIPRYLRDLMRDEKGIISEAKPVYFFK